MQIDTHKGWEIRSYQQSDGKFCARAIRPDGAYWFNTEDKTRENAISKAKERIS